MTTLFNGSAILPGLMEPETSVIFLFLKATPVMSLVGMALALSTVLTFLLAWSFFCEFAAGLYGVLETSWLLGDLSDDGCCILLII